MKKLYGTLEAVSLADLIQLAKFNNWTAKITLKNGDGEEGYIHWHKTDIQDVKWRNYSPQPSLNEAINWKNAEFNVEFDVPPLEKKINVNPEFLFMDTVKRKDRQDYYNKNKLASDTNKSGWEEIER